MNIKRLQFATETRNVSGDEAEVTISTRALDRQGDIVEPSGARLDDWKKNPTVLWAHRHDELPIARGTDITVRKSSIRARFKWLTGDPFADRVRRAWDAGVLNAASIGFLAHSHEPLPEGRGFRFTDWTLLEFSICPVPANPESLRTLKTLGLDSDDDTVIEITDDEKSIEVDEDLASAGRRIRARRNSETFDVDPAELREALREVLPDVIGHQVRDLARRLTDAALSQARGRLIDDSDAAALLGGGGADIQRIKRAERAASMADTMRAAVAKGFRMAAGRLD